MSRDDAILIAICIGGFIGAGVFAFFAFREAQGPAWIAALATAGGFLAGLLLIVKSVQPQGAASDESRALSPRAQWLLALAAVVGLFASDVLPPPWAAALWSAVAGVLGTVAVIAVRRVSGP